MGPYEKRRAKAAELAEAQGLDALALMPGSNLFYLTGVQVMLNERPTLAILPVDSPPVMILPDLEAAKAERIGFRTFAYSDAEGHQMAFHEACVALRLAEARLGVEALRMRYFESSTLRRFVPDVDLVPADDLFDELRMLKTAEELHAIRRAVDVAERAFLNWAPTLRAGISEKEAAASLVAELLGGGADSLAFDPIVASGPNAGLPHATPSQRRLEMGDWIVVDWGARVDGYVSDLTRMIVIGSPEGPLQAVHEIVLRANRAGRDAVRRGTAAEDVDAAARAVISDAGYGQYFVHRTGHGLGLEAHEPPYIVSGNRDPLEPGMTFTVEPGIYLKGMGGVRIEDDVTITDHGGETLTTLDRTPLVV